MQVVILAGGKGTRLQEVSAIIPKPMMPLAEKPILEYQIELCKKYGFTEIIILVNHLKEAIINHFKNGENFGVSISYFEEPEPLGTVGGIKEIESQIKGDFLVLYGDVMVDMNLQRLVNFHQSKKSECTLVIHPNDHPFDSDLLEIDNNQQVIAFHPKPHPHGIYLRNLVNAGVYVFSKAIFKFIEKGKKADFGTEIFPKIYAQIQMFGYNTTEYLKDMGTPKRLQKVENDVFSGIVKAKNLEQKQKAIFLDRDGVINPDKHLIFEEDKLVLYPFAAEAIKKINKSAYLCLVATNQSVVARNLIDEPGLRKIHNKLDALLGEENAKIDEIYYCPHHPDKGFEGENTAYKIDCECRKPKPGMLLKGAQEFNIDLSKSFFIGDSERDIVAGKKAGVTTIGVKTGKGLRDTTVFPDYFFDNLKSAVDFIVDAPYKNMAETIYTKVLNSKSTPFVILLAGNTRTGKSTFAVYLKKFLEENKISVFKIEMDDWIVPKAERLPNFGVFENFQFPKLIYDIHDIIQGKKIIANGYARHPERNRTPVSYQYNNQKVIFIEGVVALGNEKLNAMANLKLFKKVNEQEFIKRLYEYHKWKGLTGKEIDELYFTRKLNEYDLINNHEKFADLIIDQ